MFTSETGTWVLLLQRDVPGLTRAAVPVLVNPGWQIGLKVGTIMFYELP